MHQTTVRFSSALWADVAAEADLLGVSVAQFIREAALARLAYSAGRRGDSGWEAALRVATLETQAIQPQGAAPRLAADTAQTGHATARSEELRRQLRKDVSDTE
jgi:hypothetical protein